MMEMHKAELIGLCNLTKQRRVEPSGQTDAGLSRLCENEGFV